MSTVERRHRRSVQGEAPRAKRPLFKMIAAGSAAVFALSTAYQAAFAGSGFHHDYTGPESNDGVIIAAGVGGGLALAYAFGIAGRRHRNRNRPNGNGPGGNPGNSPSSALPVLPEGSTSLTNAQLVPNDGTIEAGTSRTFDLRVQRKGDNAWYTVTELPESSIEVKGDDTALVRQDGAKNVFLVPANCSPRENGHKVTVVGKYTPNGGQAVVAQAEIELRVSGQ
jgi:hypothetical protein